MSNKKEKRGPNASFSVLGYAKEINAGIRQNYIDGKWTDVTGGEWQHVHPGSEEADFKVAIASDADVDRAVLAARRAFDEGPWGKMKARERKLLLRPIGDIIRNNIKDLHDRQSLDNGVPTMLCNSFRFSGYMAADMFEYFAGWIDKLDGSVPPIFAQQANVHFMSLKEPVGVVAAITPFNAPVMQFAHKLAPALAAGCCVVIKPSEYASNVAMFYTKLIEKLDLPPGVLNVITGLGATGARLVGHPGVDKVAFTGRREVGAAILKAAADGFKKVTLELGGKSAGIYFEDVLDPVAAGSNAMSLVSMGLSGQICSTQTRAIVHKKIYDKFLGGAVDQIKSVRFGDPYNPATTSAPLVTKVAADNVVNHIEKAKLEGARLVTGGNRWSEAPEGNWIEPTIFADCNNSMGIARDELFGPVLSVIPFETEEEAIRLANDSEFGLSGGVYSASAGRCVRVARAMRTGTVGINGLFAAMPAGPFGGYKASGLGREGGREGIEEYCQTKTISVSLD
jgi:aldehyde dehydrogenase (NAD+)